MIRTHPPGIRLYVVYVIILMIMRMMTYVCLFITNMIQIHESNFYTDLIFSSCLGQQGPATIRFLNRNYQIFLKKAKKQFKLVCLYAHPHKFFQIHIHENVLVGRQ